MNLDNKLSYKKLTSFQEYRAYQTENISEYEKRTRYEQELSLGRDSFTTSGRCYPCGKTVEFLVDYNYSYISNNVSVINWRERLVCPHCWLVNRHRAAIHLFELVLSPGSGSKIFMGEQTTALYKWFSAKYENVMGSEFLGDSVPLGHKNEEGLRNEDFTKLSFADDSFDYIISNDIFEHIPNYEKAFQESFRVLKPGGALFFTVPFRSNMAENLVRASVKENGEIEYHLPPELHGVMKWLAYYHFGWEMLEQVCASGFSDVGAYFFWSDMFGYLGREQTVFIAYK